MVLSKFGKYCLFAMCLLVGVQATAEDKVDSKPFILPWTYELELPSKLIDQTYKLIVNFPSGYQESKEKFPVVYILDGQYHYTLVSASHGNFAWDGTIEKAIYVGISWAGENVDYSPLRQRDFTPTVDKNRTPSGGAKTFLKVLKQEIIPFVEKQYKASSDRTITGSSYGGLFALYALYNEPNLFNRVVAISPSIWWDNQVLNKSKNKFLEQELTRKTRLYAARGGYEVFQKPTNDPFGAEFSALNKTNFEFQYDVVENAGHSGVNAQGFARGIRFVFSKPSVRLSDKALATYEGVYKSDNQFAPEINFQRKGNDLLVQDPMGNLVKVHGIDDHNLYVNEFGAEVVFSKIEHGKAQKVEVKMAQQTLTFTR